MKGISLPTEVVVVVVLAVVVLIAILALFTGVFNPSVQGISLEAAKNLACQSLLSTGCDSSTNIRIENFDANKDGKLDAADTLAELCKNYYSKTTDADCQQFCGCS